jgi:lipoprotein-releasing system permease protein
MQGEGPVFMNNINFFNIFLNDVLSAKAVHQQLASALQTFIASGLIRIDNWMDKNDSLLRSMRLERQAIRVLLFLVIAVAAFNILSGMIVLLESKKSDFAILKTMGLQARGAFLILMIQGIALACMGLVMGVVLAILILNRMDGIVSGIESILRIHLFAFLDGAPVPWIFSMTDMLFVAIMTVLLCVVATLYPALQAFRIRPLEGLGCDH